MTLLNYVYAYSAVLGLMEQRCDYATAHALLLLKQSLQIHVDFYVEEEIKLALQHGVKADDGSLELSDDGRFQFMDTEQGKAYYVRKKQLEQTEMPDPNPIKIYAPERITPMQIEALRPFVLFQTFIKNVEKKGGENVRFTSDHAIS